MCIVYTVTTCETIRLREFELPAPFGPLFRTVSMFPDLKDYVNVNIIYTRIIEARLNVNSATHYETGPRVSVIMQVLL